MITVKKSEYNKAKLRKLFREASQQYIQITDEEAQELGLIEQGPTGPTGEIDPPQGPTGNTEPQGPTGEEEEHDYSKDYLTLIPLENGVFNFSGNGKYSIDNGNNWITINSGVNTEIIEKNNYILLKGLNITNIYSSCKFNICGNINSIKCEDHFRNNNYCYSFSGLFYSSSDYCKLVDASNLILPAVQLTNKCYYYMFCRCKYLLYPPKLPATNLSEKCYENMFADCTSLTTAPELPAVNLYERCYKDMFHGCTSLTTAPELPATKLSYACYNGMFSECTSLTTAPELPATILAQCCYGGYTNDGNWYNGMFENCISLTTAPELPVTNLSESCYCQMFKGCTSLTTAPALPATALANNCYYEMFANCTSLTVAPELPATILAINCYKEIFKNCSSINYIKCMSLNNEYDDNFIINSFYNWLNNTSPSGTFVKHKDAQWEIGSNGIPEGWEIIEVEE